MEQPGSSTASALTTDRDWAIASAFYFDGEGCATIGVEKRGNARYHKLIVSICQRVDRRLFLDELCEHFGGSVSVGRYRERTSK
jgi:hypothetical protein